jgi:hypothetical protein
MRPRGTSHLIGQTNALRILSCGCPAPHLNVLVSDKGPKSSDRQRETPRLCGDGNVDNWAHASHKRASHRRKSHRHTSLVSNGADVNAQAGQLGTVLCAASDGGHEKVVEMLDSSAPRCVRADTRECAGSHISVKIKGVRQQSGTDGQILDSR